MSSANGGSRIRKGDGVVETQASRRAKQRAMMIGVDRGEGAALAELTELLRTAGVSAVGETVQRRDEPDPDRYFGKGKLEELKESIQASGANLVACDDELAPRQERNLERELGVPVIDRTAVILDIFADHAHTAEGKLQVELAQLEYNLARMRGLWTHLERLGAGIGTRGPGESQIETDRRLARDRISSLRRKLKSVEKNRSVMRKRRQNASVPLIALAGYTNAGKSTLMKAVTGSDVGIGDRPFHTLDPTTRSFEHHGASYVMTDTVGFIEKLPHQLVEAFKATLEETALSDLILLVIDASSGDAGIRRELAASESVLDEIGAGDSPRLIVLNKTDRLNVEEAEDLRLGWPDACLVSALTGEGIEGLLEVVARTFEEKMEPVELLVPYGEGARLHELHEVAAAIERRDEATGVRVSARLPSTEVYRFVDLAV